MATGTGGKLFLIPELVELERDVRSGTAQNTHNSHNSTLLLTFFFCSYNAVLEEGSERGTPTTATQCEHRYIPDRCISSAVGCGGLRGDAEAAKGKRLVVSTK
jgi:hypothetical protein